MEIKKIENVNLTEEEKVEEFKRRLKYILEVKNLTQADLSRLLNVSRSAVAQYFKLKKLPSYEVIKNISDVLEIPFKWLNLETDNINQTIEIELKEKKEKIKSNIVKVPCYCCIPVSENLKGVYLNKGNEKIIFKENFYLSINFLEEIIGLDKMENVFFNNLAFLEIRRNLLLINSSLEIPQGKENFSRFIFSSSSYRFLNSEDNKTEQCFFIREDEKVAIGNYNLLDIEEYFNYYKKGINKKYTNFELKTLKEASKMAEINNNFIFGTVLLSLRNNNYKGFRNGL